MEVVFTSGAMRSLPNPAPREAIVPDLSTNTPQIDTLIEQLGAASVVDLQDQYYLAIAERFGVATYQDVIDTTLGPLTN